MKKISLLLVFLTLLMLSSCSVIHDDNGGKDNEQEIEDDNYQISYGTFTDANYLYSKMTLSVKDEIIPVYNCKVNYSHSWNPEAPQRVDNGVAIVAIDGKVTFNLKTTFKHLDRITIRPLNKEVEYQVINEKEIEFKISEVGQYTIEFSNDRTLHLFINPINQYEEYKNNANLIYFGPGIHNKNNSNYILGDNFIHASSNQTIFIDEGAVVEAGIISNGGSNITVVGNGIILGANFERSATTNAKLIPIEFNNCNNIKFLGISCLDPAGWCYNLYFSNNIVIDNIKIISSRANGDGISLQSCQNVVCENSFVRSWDDSLVVKNYPLWSNRNVEGTTKNIRFKNCLIWTDLAQSMEIGFETVGQVMDDIHFEDIIVLHNFHKAVISIHNGNNAAIKNVRYKNIIVEDASMGRGDGRNVLIELTAEFSTTWSTNHKTTALGSIDDVVIEDVKVLSSSNPSIVLRGSIDIRSGYNNSLHEITNITMKNIDISGTLLTQNYSKLEISYARNINYN